MFASFKLLFKWQQKIAIAGFALLVLAMVPNVAAVDSLEVLRVFQKNRMPSTQKIRESYTNFSYKPYKRQELSFSILIPKNDWRDIPISIASETLEKDDQQLILLAKQMAPESEKGEAKIEVAYMRLNMEIDIYDYVSIFLQNNKDNFNLLMRRKGKYNMRTVEEILVASEQNSKNYLARLTFSRHGDRVFLVSGSALESEFNQCAENFTAAAVSFSAVINSPNSYVEKMATFNSTGTPQLRFHYPETWTLEELKELGAGRNGVDIKLAVRNEKDKSVITYGYIHVSAFSGEKNKDPHQILVNLKKDFEGMLISLDQCILKADIFPNLSSPLGKLERWNAVVKGNPGEAGFLVLPKGNDYIAMGLFSMRPGDNLLTWSHTWRIFEIIANDLSAKSIDLSALKYRMLPLENQLKRITSDTMNDFAQAVGKNDFNDFYNRVSIIFKLQVTPARLYEAFKGFGKIKEMQQLKQHTPILEKEAGIDKDGILNVSGYYPTQPEATTFQLSYIQEQNKWKLLGIRVAMKKMSRSDGTPHK